MAILYSSDFPDFEEIPDSVLDEMLKAGAEIVANEQRKTAKSMLGEKGRGDGTTAESVKVQKPEASKRGGRQIAITFSGSRPNGNKTKRNAEVAFINEYGKSGQPAKQFIRIANETAADEALGRQEAIYDDWLNSQ
ncbi:MAG: hypothetical protein ACOYEB_11795 [Enterococcus lemanii]|jgi:hypothetical protein